MTRIEELLDELRRWPHSTDNNFQAVVEILQDQQKRIGELEEKSCIQ